MKTFIYIIAGILIFCFPAFSQSPAFSSETSLSKVELEKLKNGESLQLKVEAIEGEVNLVLRAINLNSSRYRKVVLGPNDTLGESAVLFTGRIRPAKSRKNFVKLTYLPGNSLDLSGSFEGLMRVNGVLYDISSNESMLIISEFDQGTALDSPGTCEAHEHSEPLPDPVTLPASVDLPTSIAEDSGLKEIELGIQIDFPLYQQLGGTTNAYNKILSIINAANGIMENDLGLTNRVVLQRIYTSESADPYTTTDSGELLNQFRADWRTNVNSDYDNAHLFSGREFDGSVVGRAWLSALCGSFKYGINEYFTNNENSLKVLFAHEQGHNMGANHDTDIMSATLRSSADKFSDFSIDEINARLPNFTCLSDVSTGNAPVLSNITNKTVTEGETLNITLAATDIDGGSLSFSVMPLSPGASISAENYSYTPPTNTVATCGQTRNITVSFEVEDDTGNTDSQDVVIAVRDSSFSQAPSLGSISRQSVNQGAQLTVQLVGTDSAGDVLNYSSPNLPSGASLDPSSGLFRWTPTVTQTGTFNVQVVAMDCAGQTSAQTMEIEVNSIPAPLNLRIQGS